jgi:hypothetical protein
MTHIPSQFQLDLLYLRAMQVLACIRMACHPYGLSGKLNQPRLQLCSCIDK